MIISDISPYHNLDHALACNKTCPACEGPTILNNGQVFGPGPLLMLSHGDDEICIDIETHDIQLQVNRHEEMIIGNSPIYYNSKMNNSYIQYGGKYAIKMQINCPNSKRHFYSVLQLWMDLDKRKLESVYLNSVSSYFQDDKKVNHMIKNLYMNSTTCYSYGRISDITTEIVVPIIPINFQNPQETIDRVKKLVIFS